VDIRTSSREWWRRTKQDGAVFEGWLLDQYRGEATAAGRIRTLRDRFAAPGSRPHRLLSAIAAQEQTHARWIAGLLEARGMPVAVEAKAERYWPEVTSGIGDLATGAAVGAHAEAMRLHRIEAIAGDPDAPEDVRAVFRRILPQERFHERAFREIAGDAALAGAAAAHERGARALGLVV